MPGKSSNPLMGKNIPPPPSPLREPQRTVTGDNGNPVKEQNGITPVSPGSEKATVELSLYLRPSQDDKLEDLRRAYKRQTGKKISANEIMRRLIERATLNDLLI